MFFAVGIGRKCDWYFNLRDLAPIQPANRVRPNGICLRFSLGQSRIRIFWFFCSFLFIQTQIVFKSHFDSLSTTQWRRLAFFPYVFQEWQSLPSYLLNAVIWIEWQPETECDDWIWCWDPIDQARKIRTLNANKNCLHLSGVNETGLSWMNRKSTSAKWQL